MLLALCSEKIEERITTAIKIIIDKSTGDLDIANLRVKIILAPVITNSISVAANKSAHLLNSKNSDVYGKKNTGIRKANVNEITLGAFFMRV